MTTHEASAKELADMLRGVAWDRQVLAIAAFLAMAYREGAEAMREAATTMGSWSCACNGCDICRLTAEIRRLPLPGGSRE